MQIGPYPIEGELGRGGMGAVYRGRAPDGRSVAVKVMLGVDRKAAERFARESRLQAALGEAQGFVPILDAGVEARGPWLVMPLMEGGSLKDRLRHGPLGVAETIALARTLAQALGRAHQLGIVHRDLKPENVLFNADGAPLISDLGLAKHFDRTAPGAGHTVELSKTGELRGTLGYMAPEQIRDAKGVGPPCDVFALGSLVYECLAGVGPFPGDAPHTRAALTLTADPEPLRSHRAEVPPWLEQLVKQALRRSPEERPADGATLAAALERGDGTQARTRQRRPRGSRWPAVVVGVAVLAGAATAIGFAIGDGETPQQVERPAPPSTSTSTEVSRRATDVSPRATSTSTPAPLVAGSPGMRDLALRVGASGAARVTGMWGSVAGASKDAATAVALVPGRDEVVTGTMVGDLVLRDGATGLPIRPLGNVASAVTALVVAPDGSCVVAAAFDGRVVAIELATGRRRWEVAGSEGTAMALEVAGNGRTVVWTGSAATVKAADLETGVARDVARLPDAALGIAALPDDRFLVAGRGGAWEVDLRDGAVGRTLAAGADLTRVAADAAGRRAVAGAQDGSVVVIDLEAGTVERLPGHRGPVWQVFISASGDRAVSLGDDHQVAVWTLPGGRCERTLEQTAPLRGGALARDGRTLITACDDHYVRRFALDDDPDGAVTLRPTWDTPELVWLSTMATLPDGRVLVTGAGAVRAFDLVAGTSSWAFRGELGTVNQVKLVPGAELAVTVGHDRSARLWSLDGKALGALTSFRNNVLSIDVSPDGRTALIGADDPTVVLWDLLSLAVIDRLSAPDLHWVTGVAFSPDGALAIAVDHGARLHVWRVADGELLATVKAHDAEGGRLAVGRRLDRVLTAAGPELAEWDLTAPGAALQPLRRLPLPVADSVSRLALTPDGQRVYVVAGPTVLVVDVETGRELGRLDLSPLGLLPYGLGVLPDGSGLVGTWEGALLRFAVGP